MTPRPLVYLLNPFKILLCVLVTFFFSLLVCLLVPFCKRERPVFTRIQKTWGWMLLKILQIRVNTQGLTQVHPSAPRMFLANHSSYLDIFVLTARLPGKVIFLGKRELNKVPLFGWSWVIAGNVPIDRHSPRAFMQSLDLAAHRIRQGYSLVIFPEGTRSPDGKIHPFKRGFIRIAQKSRATIYPVTINGAFRSFKKGDKVIQPARLELIVHPPIQPDYQQNPREIEVQILQQSRKKIIQAYRDPRGRQEETRRK